MNSLFDQAIDRRGSDSFKWQRYAGRDIIPMWVADMDFAAPPPVLDALQQRIAHGVLGYAHESDSLIEATQDYLQRHYNWKIEADWLVWLPGLVPGMNLACQAVDGGVFAMTPVYAPMVAAGSNTGREVTTLSFQDGENGWHWDFDAVEKELAASKSRLWLLCHPHNPLGREWNEAELREIARLADKHDIVVCSNEIHCGLILDPARKHRPFATMDADAAARSITLMAPSKTYNIAGLGASFAVIPDADLRRRFKRAAQGVVPHINILGLVAMEAALRHCDDWLLELNAYLRGNADRVHSVINALPGLRMHRAEATYLAWIDARQLCAERGIADPHALFERAGVGLSAGRDFADANSSQYLRLNFGCPHSTLDTALERLRNLPA